MTKRDPFTLPAKMAAAPYDAAAKRRWLSTARSFAKALATQLELPKGSYEVRTNKGGIAVPGEVTLHGENLYVCIGTSMPGGELVGFARSCNGRKDYSGGVNRWLSARMTWDQWVQVCREAMGERGAA